MTADAPRGVPKISPTYSGRFKPANKRFVIRPAICAICADGSQTVDRQSFKWHSILMRSAEVSESITGFPVERLQRALAWLDKTKGIPKGVALAKDVALWFARVEALRQREDDLLAEGASQAARAEHKVIVSRLIAEGGVLLKRSKRAGVAKLPSGVSLEDLRAAVDSLRMTFRCQHAPENTPKVNALIGKLFNGS